MKLVIDVLEDYYKAICKRVKRFGKASVVLPTAERIIFDGTPLEDIKVEIQNTILEQAYEKGQIDVLDKIRTEIGDTGAYEQEVNGKTEFVKGITYCLNIIDKYKAESEE